MPNLLFCMTPGVGLNAWQRIGSMNRELRPYVEYVRRGWKVKVLTFDNEEIPKLPEGIEAVRFPYPHRLLWFLPWIHMDIGIWADVIKTNQTNHAYLYTRAARKWKKPILLRCGFVRGEYLETTIGLTPKVRFYQILEAMAFQQATHCQVPTHELSEWVQRKYNIPEKKMSVVPNFVDVDLFKPMPEAKKVEKSVISIGRLAPVKQFELLIRACAEIPGCMLTIVGEGLERMNLGNLAKELKVNLSLPGNIPNENLPEILNRYQVFAITSKREGHPKALIEAMACGMACLGVNTPGIINAIQQNKTGVLVDPSVLEVKRGLYKLFDNIFFRKNLGALARNYVVDNLSFEKCSEAEFSLVAKINASYTLEYR